jgi:hypothetical protein
MTKDDYDGVIMNKCIAIDVRELADLKARGVKNYEIHYSGGTVYSISLSKFSQWSHPVVGNREGDGEQECVSWRHWDVRMSGAKAKAKAKAKVAKAKIAKREKTMLQGSLFSFLKGGA